MVSLQEALELHQGKLVSYYRSARVGYYVVKVSIGEPSQIKTFTNVSRKTLELFLASMTNHTLDPLPPSDCESEMLSPTIKPLLRKRPASHGPKHLNTKKSKKDRENSAVVSSQLQLPDISLDASVCMSSPLRTSLKKSSILTQIPLSCPTLQHSSPLPSGLTVGSLDRPSTPVIHTRLSKFNKDTTLQALQSTSTSSQVDIPHFRTEARVPRDCAPQYNFQAELQRQLQSAKREQFFNFTSEAAAARRPPELSFGPATSQQLPNHQKYLHGFQQQAFQKFQDYHRQRNLILSSSFVAPSSFGLQSSYSDGLFHLGNCLQDQNVTSAVDHSSTQFFDYEMGTTRPSSVNSSGMNVVHVQNGTTGFDSVPIFEQFSLHTRDPIKHETSSTPLPASPSNNGNIGSVDTFCFNRDRHQEYTITSEQSIATEVPVYKSEEADGEQKDIINTSESVYDAQMTGKKEEIESVAEVFNEQGKKHPPFEMVMTEMNGVIWSKVSLHEYVSIAVEVEERDMEPLRGKYPTLRPPCKKEVIWFKNVPIIKIVDYQHLLSYCDDVQMPLADDMLDDLEYFDNLCSWTETKTTEDNGVADKKPLVNTDELDQEDIGEDNKNQYNKCRKVKILYMKVQVSTFFVNVTYEMPDCKIVEGFFKVTADELDKYGHDERKDN